MVGGVEGVLSVTVTLATGEGLIKHDSSVVTPQSIEDTINGIGTKFT